MLGIVHRVTPRMSVPRIGQKLDSCKIECSLWKADIFRFRISVPTFAVAKLICDILAALCDLPASPERVKGSHSFGWVCPSKASVPVPLGRMWHSHTGGRTLLGIVHHITLSMYVPRIERFARFVLNVIRKIYIKKSLENK